MERLLWLALMSSLSLQLKAQEGPVLHLHCDPAHSRVEMAMEPLRDSVSSGSFEAERIEVDKLVAYSQENDRGEVYRLGSRSTTRACGRLVLKISGGFFNVNPQGEMGAADDYPIVEIFNGGKPLTVPLAVGKCDASNARYSASAECPGNWASHITVSGDHGLVRLRHEYEEYRGGIWSKDQDASAATQSWRKL